MKKTISLLIALLLLISSLSVYAADEKKVLLESDKAEITKGEKVEISISSDELTGIEGTLKFESKDWKLETKTSENSFTLNEKTGKFALANISGEEKISVKLTLKSKESSTATSSTISIVNITGSNKSNESFNISDKSVTIKFKNAQSSKKSSNTTTNSTTTVSGSSSSGEYKVVPAKSQDKEMPKTGAKRMFIGITVIAVTSCALYIGYRKNNY